ncbi:MAG: hypothetical protein N4A38_01915 [Candidatus Gracilibacteria bacterium]|nr:hypothetical protein [Candidatus Gracilibacteria bacterium]
MKDIVSKYKRKNKINTVFIVGASLALALVINATFSDNNFARMMRTSVVDGQVAAETKADVYSEVDNGLDKTIISIKSSKALNKAKNISFSFSFNPEKTELKTMFAFFKGAEIIKTENNPGFATVFVNFKEPTDISENKKILDIVVTKDGESVNHIALNNVNFKDSEDNNYELTSSGAEF